MEKVFTRFANTKFIVLFIAIFLLINIGFSLVFKHMEAEILDVQFFYTAEKAYQIIDSYGQTDREIYMQGTIALDFIYPIVYSIMLSLLLFRATKDQIIALLPFSILILDYFENIALLTIIYNYPVRINPIAAAAGIITSLKWIMVVITVLVIVFYGLKNKLSKKEIQ